MVESKQSCERVACGTGGRIMHEGCGSTERMSAGEAKRIVWLIDCALCWPPSLRPVPNVASFRQKTMLGPLDVYDINICAIRLYVMCVSLFRVM